MFRVRSSRPSLLLALAIALGIPLSVGAQSGIDLAPPAATDLTSGIESTQLTEDVLGSELIQGPDRQQPDEEPSRPGLSFALWALALASLALAITTGIFLALFVKTIDKGISAESHWGGFGGGVGGWRASPALVYLLAAFVFGSLFTLLVLRLADVVAPQPKDKDKPAATGAPAGGTKDTEKTETTGSGGSS